MVDADLPAQTVEDTIRQAGSDLLRQVTLFDLYQGEQIAARQEEPGLCLNVSSRGPQFDRRRGAHHLSAYSAAYSGDARSTATPVKYTWHVAKSLYCRYSTAAKNLSHSYT